MLAFSCWHAISVPDAGAKLAKPPADLSERRLCRGTTDRAHTRVVSHFLPRRPRLVFIELPIRFRPAGRGATGIESARGRKIHSFLLSFPSSLLAFPANRGLVFAGSPHDGLCLVSAPPRRTGDRRVRLKRRGAPPAERTVFDTNDSAASAYTSEHQSPLASPNC